MNVIRSKVNERTGMETVTVEIPRGCSLVAVQKGCFYRLSGQMDDVVPDHVISDVSRVVWSHFEQKWVDA